jgi:hypothetical protein
MDLKKNAESRIKRASDMLVSTQPILHFLSNLADPYTCSSSAVHNFQPLFTPEEPVKAFDAEISAATKFDKLCTIVGPSFSCNTHSGQRSADWWEVQRYTWRPSSGRLIELGRLPRRLQAMSSSMDIGSRVASVWFVRAASPARLAFPLELRKGLTFSYSAPEVVRLG